MYTTDGKDEVIALEDVPQCDAGVPWPIVIGDEGCLMLAYNAATWPEDDEIVAIIRVVSPYAHMFGPPNDEALHGHPLGGILGNRIAPYGAYEVRNSSWIRALESMNAVHPMHQKSTFLKDKRHFIFTFHDSTFECVAEDFNIGILERPLENAVDEMVKILKGWLPEVFRIGNFPP